MRREGLSHRKQSIWTGLKALDEASHGSLQGTEAVRLGLFQSLLVLPVIVSDPVARQDGPSTIRAPPAVDEHRPAVAVPQDAQGLGNLLWRGRANAPHGNADEAHSVRLDHLLLVRDRMLVDPAQINNRLDPAFGQFLEAVVAGLAAAKHLIVDHVEIRKGILASERRGSAQKRG